MPTSNFTNNGIIGGSINRYTNNPFAYDQSNGGSKQWSGDLRFNTNFEGPVNFMLGFYYLSSLGSGDYFVGANTLDYGQTLIGALLGPFVEVPHCGGAVDIINGFDTTGCIYGTPYYDNRTDRTIRTVQGGLWRRLLADRSPVETDNRPARNGRQQGATWPHRDLQRL